MLSISKVESLSHGLDYYAKDNYYSNNHQEYTQWFGKVAEEFGLKNEVNLKDFNRALLGISKSGKLGGDEIKKEDTYVVSAKINEIREKSYSFLKTSSLHPNAQKSICQSLYKLSERREKIPKTNLERYQNQIASIINRSDISNSEKMSIKEYFQNELKIFELKIVRRMAYDLTFSAPKTVSLAALVAGDKDLINAHRSAVETALKVLEKDYSQIRVRNKYLTQRQIEVTGNIAVATFEHDVSRKVDPQLHTHCVLMTFTKRSDGSWRSIYQDGFFYDSKKLGLIYQKELARRVLSLGYDVQVHSNGTFDLNGYTREQIESFSKRTCQLKAMGANTQKEKTKIIKKNRNKKEMHFSRESLREMWKIEAQNLGISHPLKNCQNHITNKNIQESKSLTKRIIII